MSNIVLISVLSLVIIVLLLLLFISSRRLRQQKQQARLEKASLEAESNAYIEKLKILHSQEISALKELQQAALAELNSDPKQIVKAEIQTAKVQAQEIVAEAEATAQSILAEAQEKAKLALQREQENLQKSIVTIVIQVVKNVLDKTLSYEDHKQIILTALREIK